MSEFISLKQQRLASNLRERIAEAVAEIKTRRMPALAVAAPGLTSRIGLFCGDGLDRETTKRPRRYDQMRFFQGSASQETLKSMVGVTGI